MVDYSELYSERVKMVKPSGIRKFFDAVSNMQGAISLGVGEPDFETPWQIRRAGIASLEKGKTFYTSNWGLAELREEIGAMVKRRYGIAYDTDKGILVTVGGSEAIDNALRAFVGPGDEVLVPEPSFVCYSPLVTMTGGTPVGIDTVAEEGFKLTPERLRAAITPRTKMLVLPYPNNPTGAIMNREELEEIAAILRDTNILVLSDEIYCDLTYQGEHVCFAELDGMQERTIVVGGFSKSYAMTGWRLGWAMGPREMMSPLCKLHQYGIMSAPTTSQFAAIEALRTGEDDIQRMKLQYDLRRRYLVGELRAMGLDCFEPMGAFYAFPSIKSTGLSSEAFCNRLLEDQKVAVVPGNAFGESGEGYIRISYSYSMAHLREAVKRMKIFLNKLKTEKENNKWV